VGLYLGLKIAMGIVDSALVCLAPTTEGINNELADIGCYLPVVLGGFIHLGPDALESLCGILDSEI
jgi:hypothetical protein